MPLPPEQLLACLRALEDVARLSPDDPDYVAVERSVAKLRKTAKQKRRSTRRKEASAADRKTIDSTVGARAHLGRLDDHPLLSSDVVDTRLKRTRRCIVCKERYAEVHARYPHHCPSCGDVDLAKREQRADLRGRRALITGGRIKIGYALALKMLRDGAHVALTTRFPEDAKLRFAEEQDAETWSDRLEVHPMNLADLPSLLSWLSARKEAWPHLDILVNNAAQTVRRPPSYYARWALAEKVEQTPFLLPFYDQCLSSNPLARGRETDPIDEEGLPLDTRPTNSWKLEADDVDTIELAEVMVINTIAPFLLTTQLSPLLRKSPFPDRYVVHASAVEGQFRAFFKSPRHPHTNMAKAALNMFTRTSASSYATSGIYMTSVDTGWITNENPQRERDVQRAHGFRPPLDAIDGAARLYDPIVQGVTHAKRLFGVLLKDYVPVEW
jgi:NAD(P)-dependent dehydrogenase (short-subunit alcohol dehydrogenase family)